MFEGMNTAASQRLQIFFHAWKKDRRVDAHPRIRFHSPPYVQGRRSHPGEVTSEGLADRFCHKDSMRRSLSGAVISLTRKNHQSRNKGRE
jgi:hypothetical protein